MRVKLVQLLVSLCLLLAVFDAWSVPKIQSWKTTEGADVLFVPAPELPMLDIRVVFDAGSARDGAKPGLAKFTNAVMTDAGGSWDVDQVAERLESVGAILGAGSQRDMGWVSLRTLTEKRPMTIALETMQALLEAPLFDNGDLERTRQALLIGLRRVEQSPSAIASRVFWEKLYGDHPYASYKSGNESSIKGIQREDLIQFYRRYYTASNTVVAIVGAIDRQVAEQIAEQLTGGLPKGSKPPLLPEVTGLSGAIEEKIHFPSTQSHIVMGQPGSYRGDPDHFALYVGNHILGGSGLVSILGEEVREKRGLSYSVYSYFSPMRRRGPFVLGAQTKNENAGEALRVIHKTLNHYIQNGPTAKELKEAKQNITGGFPLLVASNGEIVEYLAMIGFYGLPLDYLDTFVGNIDAVSREQVMEVFKRRLNPEKFVTVVVGNGKENGTH